MKITHAVLVGDVRYGFRVETLVEGGESTPKGISAIYPAGVYNDGFEVGNRLDATTYGGFAIKVPYWALVGNLSDGYWVYGPYLTFDEAAEQHDGQESWIVGGESIDY